MRARVVFLLGFAAALAGVAAQEPTFRTETDLVHLVATVTDRRGAVITDLTRADFEVLEDGRPQDIRHFAIGEVGDAGPLHLGLLLDTSRSMEIDIDTARSAAIRFLNTLVDAEDMTLVDFDTEIRMSRFRPDDFPRLVERIRNRRPDGWTAFYDALGVFLAGADGDDGRTILVVLTDGGDTRSRMRWDDVITAVRASDVTIHVIGLIERHTPTARLVERLRLTEIAETSGGQAIFPSSMKQIEEAYARIAEQVQAQYSLGYVSSNTDDDGRWRRVRLRVRRADGDDLRIHTRAGYFK